MNSVKLITKLPLVYFLSTFLLSLFSVKEVKSFVLSLQFLARWLHLVTFLAVSPLCSVAVMGQSNAALCTWS